MGLQHWDDLTDDQRNQVVATLVFDEQQRWSYTTSMTAAWRLVNWMNPYSISADGSVATNTSDPRIVAKQQFVQWLDRAALLWSLEAPQAANAICEKVLTLLGVQLKPFIARRDGIVQDHLDWLELELDRLAIYPDSPSQTSMAIPRVALFSKIEPEHA